jgi:ketosteroid isomerase-like protein
LRWPYVARDWDGFASFFTEDAVWMPPDQPPLIGKDAWWSWIGEGWEQSTIEQLNSSHEEIVISGDWAYERHNETQIGPGRQMNFKGIFIMHRQVGGSWKIARYCFNLSPVPDN